MAEVVAAAPAKINLFLRVGERRPDGYHALATVYQAIGRYDEVAARRATEFSVEVHAEGRTDISTVPTDGTNLAVRAARTLADRRGVSEAAHLRITKSIPVAGGMAGGSADAAAALVACDELWGTRTPQSEMLAVAAELGSDVPFALLGGTAVGTGRGELVSPLRSRARPWWVVQESGQGLSTAQVYREHDRLRAGRLVAEPAVPEALQAALELGNLRALGAAMENDLQAAALRLRPELAGPLCLGRDPSVLGAVLAGSGPTCLFLTEGPVHARGLAERLTGHRLGPVWYAPAPVGGARLVR